MRRNVLKSSYIATQLSRTSVGMNSRWSTSTSMSVNFVNSRWIGAVPWIVSIVLLWWCHRKWLFGGKIIITLPICMGHVSIHERTWIIQSSFLSCFSVSILFLNNSQGNLRSLFHILRLNRLVITTSIPIHISIFIMMLTLLFQLLFPVWITLFIITDIVVYLVVDTLHHHAFLLLCITVSSSWRIRALNLNVADVPLLFAFSEKRSWSDNSRWLLGWNIQDVVSHVIIVKVGRREYLIGCRVLVYFVKW